MPGDTQRTAWPAPTLLEREGGPASLGQSAPQRVRGVRQSLHSAGGLAPTAATIACPKSQPPLDTDTHAGNPGTLSGRELRLPGPSQAHTPCGGPHKNADPSPHRTDRTQGLEELGGRGA